MNSWSDEQEEDSMPMATNRKTGNAALQPCSSSEKNLKRQKISHESTANLKKQKETESKKEDSCCFGCEEAFEPCLDSIIVKGFQHLRPRDEIKNELSNIFGSCGKDLRVFVPMQCVTCVPLGFAFINIANGSKNEALKLNGSYMGGRKLEVKMAPHSAEYYGYPPNFSGCDLCHGRWARMRLLRIAPKLYGPDKVYSAIQAKMLH